MRSMTRVRSVAPLKERVLRCTFTNGEVRDIDVSGFLKGPVFDRVRSDDAFFRSVHVDARSGTVVWENGADIDPDVLYGRFPPASAQEHRKAA